MALIVKTREAWLTQAQVVEGVAELHSYECPCVVAMPIVGGHHAYLGWLMDETVQADMEGFTDG